MAVVEKQVIASSDDCYRQLTPSGWDLTTGYQYAGCRDSSNYQYGGGMRFQAIAIPKGAVITAAYLTFQAHFNLAGTIVRTRISAEDVDDAPTFADDAATFDTRWTNRTAARVDWDEIPAWTQGEDYDSPSIVSVIQEIVNRDNWASGNDIVIFWEDFDDRSDHNEAARRIALSYDGDTTYCPKLHIEYTIGGEVYDEKNKLQVILATVGESDKYQHNELNKEQVVSAILSRSDSQQMKEIGKGQTILATVNEADVQQMVELNKEQVALAVLSRSDNQQMSELAKEQVALAVLNELDTMVMNELNKLQVILAVITKWESGIVYDEKDKLQVILAIMDESDTLQMKELNKEQVALVVLAQSDMMLINELDKLQIVLAILTEEDFRTRKGIRNLAAARRLAAIRNLPA